MSGHSKWSKIKRKKGANDAKRSKIFGRIIKEITVAVREGQSGDAEFNPRLRLAISNAKGANMPKETIDRAIKKALESKADALYMPTFEGYAPGGVAIFVETMTDNNQRTVANVRAAFNKRGGNLATTGSVGFMFERKGIFLFDTSGKDLEELELEMIDAGAEDFDFDDESNEVEVTVDFADFGAIQKKLEELGIEPKSATLERIATTTTKVALDDAKKALALVEYLEEDEDVQAVFHNLEMTDEIMEALEE